MMSVKGVNQVSKNPIAEVRESEPNNENTIVRGITQASNHWIAKLWNYGLIGLARGSEVISASNRVVMLQVLSEILVANPLWMMTTIRFVVRVGTLVSAGVYLVVTTLWNVYLWRSGRIDGETCVKKILVNAGSMAGAIGGAFGGAAIGSLLGPVGAVVGGILGAIAGGFLCEKLCQKLLAIRWMDKLKAAFRLLKSKFVSSTIATTRQCRLVLKEHHLNTGVACLRMIETMMIEEIKSDDAIAVNSVKIDTGAKKLGSRIREFFRKLGRRLRRKRVGDSRSE